MRTIDVSIKGGSISNNGIITVTRGDTFSVTLREVEINENDTLPILKEGDTLYFGLMEPHQPFEYALIRKMVEVPAEYQGSITIDFSPEMTEFLMPGKYYYSIKMRSVDSQTEFETVLTLKKKTRFNIID